MTQTKTIERLSPDRIERLSSPYFKAGGRTDAWQIDSMEIEDNHVRGMIRMTDFYVSATDTNGFHLSFLTAVEMVAQLTIIYLHHHAGLEQKSREVWISESRNHFLRPVRTPEAIRVDMTIERLRKRGESLFCVADYQVTDEQGGLLKYWAKTYLI